MIERWMKSAAVCVLAMSSLAAQDLVGSWQGKATAPNGQEMQVVFQIARGADQKLNATVRRVDQPAQPFNAPVTQAGTTVKIDLLSVGGSYEGKLAADGNTITGSLTLNNAPSPMNLARATPETAWVIPDPPKPPAPMAADVDPSFEVATIKPTAPGRTGSNINVRAGGQFVTGNTPLKTLIVTGYSVHPDQIAGLPEWAETEPWDIDARMAQEGVPNVDQMRTMLRKLLAERFQLKLRTEKREVSAYTLTALKDGHKMTENSSGNALPGFSGLGPGGMGVRNSTMAEFASFFQSRAVDRPVVDKTGLKGKYDFTLMWRPDNLAPQGPNAPALPADIESRPNLFAAFQEQLGLKLEAEKTLVDVLVVEKVERPSEN